MMVESGWRTQSMINLDRSAKRLAKIRLDRAIADILKRIADSKE